MISNNYIIPVVVGVCYFLSIVNVTLIGPLRLAEILLLLVSPFILNSIFKKKVFFYSLLFFLVFMILLFSSSIKGLYIGGGELERLLGFIYKYTFIFLTVCAGVSLGFLHSKNYFGNKFVIFSIYFTYLSMMVWSVFYSYFLGDLVNGPIVTRVAFPTNNFEETDAHLYSFCLGFLTLFYLFYIRVRLGHGLFLSFSLLMLSIFSLILTGSRTGLLAIFLCLVLFYFYIILKSSNGRSAFYVFLLCSPLLLLIFDIEALDLGVNSLAFERLFMSGDQDESSLNRIFKLKYALSLFNMHAGAFGVGPVLGPITWYDNIVAVLILHFGPVGVILYFFVFMVVFSLVLLGKIPLYEKVCSVIMLFYLFFCLFITEYVLVSRGAFIVVFPLSYYLVRNYGLKG